MIYLVEAGQVVGILADGVNPPDNMLAIASDLDILDVSKLYYDDSEIHLRPPQPSPDAYWDFEANEWEEPEDLPVAIAQNWQGLLDDLRESPVWARSWGAAKVDTAAQAAFSLLLTAMGSVHYIPDVVFGLAELRSALQSNPSLSDFTTEELGLIAAALEEHGFDPDDFDLAPSP